MCFDSGDFATTMLRNNNIEENPILSLVTMTSLNFTFVIASFYCHMAYALLIAMDVVIDITETMLNISHY